MKLLNCCCAAILLLCIHADVFSQSHFTHTVTSVAQESQISPAGRDFWFAVPQNSDPNDDAEKVFTVYSTSKSKATIYLQINGQNSVTKTINPGEVWAYVLPRSVELNSSLTTESDKAIHVWSEDAVISVFFLSRNPFTSDGFMVIPRILWDTEYVVASYSALIVSPQFDLPSEFCVIADADSTLITITPSRDIRQTGAPSTPFHSKGNPFTIQLDRGECMQFQTVFDLGGSELDLTGTVVKSDKPIGVIGASACPFIPADPYCDHICEMLLPVSRWGKTYHTIPFAGRKPPGGDAFYVIGSTPGQTIFRNGNHYAAVGQFEKYFRDDINEPSVWTSSLPFMLVQYINSATYGVPTGGSRNQGDPAMVQINPAEYARKELAIHVPMINPGSSQPAFTDYVNIIVPTAAITSLYFDSIVATSFPNVRRLSIPGTGYEGLRLPGVKDGTHSIRCDSPITAYAYGYATDDSYAWSVLGPDVQITKIADSIPPVVVATDSCNCTTISISDVHPKASKISSVVVAATSNLSVTIDPTFVQGTPKASTFYRLCNLNGMNGSARVTITDSLGNSSAVHSTYIPSLFRFNASPSVEFTLVEHATRDTTFLLINLTGDTLKPIIPAEFIGSNRFAMSPSVLPALPPDSSIEVTIRFLGSDTTQEAIFVFSYDSCMVDSTLFKATVVPAGSVTRMKRVVVNIQLRNRALNVTHNSIHASTIELYDMLGKLWLRQELRDMEELVPLPAAITGGSYIVRYSTAGYITSRIIQVLQ